MGVYRFSFIKSVVTGAYDEKGYIYYDATDYTSNNLYNEFASDLYREEIVTTGQMGTLMPWLRRGGLHNRHPRYPCN